MTTLLASATSPFDPISGDLLPDYRDAYVQGQLDPALAATVETYLKSSPLQTNIVLGRAQELAAAAAAAQRTFVPPSWVQQQLRFQPTASALGPLRRPVVQLGLGVFAALLLASFVQWLRNEPLVPAPVVQAVAKAATSARQATRQLVQHLRPAAPAATAARPKPAPAASAAPRHAARPPKAVAVAAMPVRVAKVALSSDSVVGKATETASAASAPVITNLLRGRITDTAGNPLPGATILVTGSKLATSTNASGEYQLAVPAGAVLQIGYGGYADQALPVPAGNVLNVMLLPAASAKNILRGRR